MRLLLILAIVVVFAAILLNLFFGSRGPTDEHRIGCKTKGSHMKFRTTDNNLHVTIWCVKDGKVVQ